jgi:hypothetical protein
MSYKTIGDSVQENLEEFKKQRGYNTAWGIEKLGLKQLATKLAPNIGDINGAGNIYVCTLQIILDLQEKIASLESNITYLENIIANKMVI